ncbi:MAG: hypothetical protein A2Y33_07050 [Spirochaetes bacterium GWF1_51_8]|nr:MAG: hypothetical protein A2Y33_07050 [Spirochaetes bacterium GWF1_51_8]
MASLIPPQGQGELRKAGLFARFLAATIDGIILFFFSPLVNGIFTGSFSFGIQTNTASGGSVLYVLVYLLIAIAYFAIMESSAYQATIGKMLAGIYVADKDTNGRPKLLSVLIRAAMRTLTGWFGFLGLFLSKDKRTLHDIAAGTNVYRLEDKKDEKLFDSLYPRGYEPYHFRWFDYAIAFMLLIITSIGYIQTLSPSVCAGDSGELTTAVYDMGACHPPGYPIYGVIGKLFTFLPFGDIAYRVNLFSAISAAVSVFFLYLFLVKLLGLNRDRKELSLSVHIPAIAGSILFAFSATLWSQAVIGEVYALNTALVSALLFVMIQWYEEMVYFRKEKTLHFAERGTLLLAFVMGLSLTDHQLPLWYIVTWAIVLVVITMLILVSERPRDFINQLKKRVGVIVMLVIVMGIAAFLFLKLAYTSRLIPKISDAPDTFWIVFSILIIPVFLTLYVLYAKKAYKGEENWVDRFLEIFMQSFWLFLFGMSIYAYLVIRAMAVAPLPEPKPLSWGDTQTLDILFNHMLRKQYGLGGSNVANFGGQVMAVLELIVKQFHWINMIFAAIGMVYMAIKEKVWFLYTMVSTVLFTLVMIAFVNFEVDPRTMSFQEVMYIQMFLFIAVYIAFGYQCVLDMTKGIKKFISEARPASAETEGN